MSTVLQRLDLARILMPTWRALLEAETRRCAQHGLEHWHYIVLADVQEHPRSSQREVARRVVRSASRLATDVEQLRDRGLLLRESDGQDRRLNRLTLTPEGEAMTQRIRDRIHADEARLLWRLSEAEQTDLRRLLEKILDPETL